MPRRDIWSEDENVVVLDLYLRRGPLAATDPEVIGLTELIGRKENAIPMRMANYQHEDPNYPGKGLDGGGEPVQRVWDKYATQPEALKQAVVDALSRLEERRSTRERAKRTAESGKGSVQQSSFEWIAFYEEMANRLLAFRDRRSDLLKGIEEIASSVGGLSYLKDRSMDGTMGPLIDICPFSVFGMFNRGITVASRTKVASKLAGLLGATKEAPKSFDGIPVLNNQRTMFFSWANEREPSDIDCLWELFGAALNLADSHTEQNRIAFAEAYDKSTNVKGVGWNLSMGLYWIRPRFFATLDSRSQAFLQHELDIEFGTSGPKGYCSANDYLDLVDQLRTRFTEQDFPVHSFPELSLASWNYTHIGNQVDPQGGATKKAFLLTWNPTNWPWSELDEVAHAVKSGLPYEAHTGSGRWSITTKSVKPGDRLFVVRVGKEPKGIMGSAVATSDAYEDQHWSGEEGKKAFYVDLKWDSLLVPSKQSPLTLESLRSDVDHSFHWTPQNSGVSISGSTLQKLEARWAKHLELSKANPQPSIPLDQASSKPFTIADVVEDLFYDPDVVRGWLELLRQKKNLILQGPPGVGKTLVARRLAFGLLGVVARAQIEWLQFHQSYSYEDFIQGWRPSQAGFDLQPGRFLQVCARAEREPNKVFVLVIDEINRGNLSRIFGEALSLLETDKRGPDHALTLSYHSTDAQKASQRFFVPENLYVIGMMNTADRSLALVDYALRRRFGFVSLSPQFASEGFKDFLKARGVPKKLITHIVSSMEDINKAICEDQRHLGEGFQIGHSFFCPPAELSAGFESWFAGVVEHEILPLLQEYWIDQEGKVAEVRDALKYVDSNS